MKRRIPPQPPWPDTNSDHKTNENNEDLFPDAPGDTNRQNLPNKKKELRKCHLSKKWRRRKIKSASENEVNAGEDENKRCLPQKSIQITGLNLQEDNIEENSATEDFSDEEDSSSEDSENKMQKTEKKLLEL